MANKSPRRTLVVIDVQNEYVTGNFRIEYPDVQSSLAKIGQAMDTAAALNIPIVLVQHILPPDAPIFAQGSAGVALHPGVVNRHYDYLVTKTFPSVFAGTNFADWLRDKGIDTLTIVGYMTHCCGDSTMRQAMHEGFSVEFLHDAAGSLSYKNSAGSASAEEIHRVTMVVMESAYAAVMTTDDWIAHIQTGKHAPHDNVFSSNRRAVVTR